MALLDIVQDAASQLGLRQPALVVGSTDLTAQILLRFANQSGKELAKYHDWQALIVQQTFTTLAQYEQTGALGDDYDRMAYNVEVWNRTENMRFAGPAPQRTRAVLMNSSTGGTSRYWWIAGGELNIFPTPTAGQTLAFEYISKHWCESALGVGQERFLADTDSSLLQEDLITMDVVWRYRHSRGFAQYAEDMVSASRAKELASSRDRGTGRIRPEMSDGAEPPQPYWNGSIDG